MAEIRQSTDHGRNSVLSSRPVSSAVDLRSDSLALCAVGGLIILTAIWMSLTRFERGQNADSVVPVLVSLQHWTPFFWGTNRYGMLIPLLAMPFSNPLTNLILQTALGIASGLAASFLLVRYFFEDSPYWLTAAALQNVWLFLLVPRYTQFDWFVVQCYGLSFTLAFSALILLRKQRMVWALVLMFLSHWVNSAAFVLLVPLIVQRHWIDRQKRGLLPALAVVMAGAAGGFALMLLFPSNDKTLGLAPSSTWLHGLSETIRLSRGGTLTHTLSGLWILVPTGVGFVGLVLSQCQKRVLLVCVALADTAIVYWLFTDTLEWVRESLHGMRYVYPSILLVMVAMALLAVAPFERRLSTKRWGAVYATCVMFLAAVIGFGWPSISRIPRDFHNHFGFMTADILASQAPVVAGNYWNVWPAVFDANSALYQRGEQRRVYGLTYRSERTLDLLPQRQGICVDAIRNDDSAPNYLRGRDGISNLRANSTRC